MAKAALFDTHCHIHASEFAKNSALTADQQIEEAIKDGVNRFICVGTDVLSSIEAISFVQGRENCYASVALHPHEAAGKTSHELVECVAMLDKLVQENQAKQIVAIGECGLDYYYHATDEVREKQKELLRLHIDIALKYDLPVIFHIRDAFDDFFAVIDSYPNIRGVVHSFSAGTKELDGVLSRGLYVGLNGIMTFTKQIQQLDAAKAVPLNKMVLETDAPFLTPAPFRGKMCMPKHLRVTAVFLSELRNESLVHLTEITSRNAQDLFGIK